MVQGVIVCLLFLCALVYLARMLYQQFKPGRAGCAKGCSSCSALDIKKIESQIRKAQTES